ncbi:MAG: N-acetyl-gamma-glutamyl-phosphate reductase [Deltaproteobacteria bacterium]|nr:N-acetyl-gamma-glutamyl-phosphate reductase [Deltaproteobacteria bacterium]
MSQGNLRVAVAGATGYAGAELLRLLQSHPEVGHLRALARSETGKTVAELFPSFPGERGAGALVLEPLGEPEAVAADLAGECDLVFLALPHATSAALAAPLHAAGLKVIDLSADFRLRDPDVYAGWYGEHPCPELIPEAVYGLPERYREALKEATLIAAPGCYPTATLLSILPLLEAGLVDGGIIADCKSGTSGAGRSPKVGTLLSEAGEQISAYGIAAHRHEPEIAQEAGHAAGHAIRVTFTPHLVPMSRGILATVYLGTTEEAPEDEEGLRALYREHYRDEPFVEVLPAGRFPGTGSVRGSNRCAIGVTRHPRSGQVIAVSAIDNLIKGAAGQAIQCMNLCCGLPETAGLTPMGLLP